MSTSKTFKTKTGYCHITETHIVLTKNDTLGDFKTQGESKIALFLSAYSLIGIFLSYRSIKEFQRDDYPMAILYGLVGVILLYVVVKSRKNSSTSVIERSSVQEVKFNNSRPGLARAYFEVVFRNAKGNVKKRLIMLPGSLSDGREATEQALKIFKEEHLIQ